MSASRSTAGWVPAYLVALTLIVLVVMVAALGQGPWSAVASHPTHPAQPPPTGPAGDAAPLDGPEAGDEPFDRGEQEPGGTEEPTDPGDPDDQATAPSAAPAVGEQPGGGWEVFAKKRVLVAYYGSANTAALGVLGQAPPEKIIKRLRRAAKPFGAGGRQVQPVFELIVTIAHAHPTKHGTYSADIAKKAVRPYLRAARKHGVIVVLDLQPGRADFLTVAKRWEWALRKPWVGLALDPEWRMGPHQVPGRVIGSVRAHEVNRVSRWLDRLTADHELPEKILMLHQFRADMIRNPAAIKDRPHLAIVQHVDGFGTRSQKLDTYRHVARPRQFTMGFKLFYTEDTHLFGPRDVLAIRPRVRFVSYQ